MNFNAAITTPTPLSQVLKTPQVLGTSPLPPHARSSFCPAPDVAKKTIVNPADR
jgi:hypothetical protein